MIEVPKGPSGMQVGQLLKGSWFHSSAAQTTYTLFPLYTVLRMFLPNLIKLFQVKPKHSSFTEGNNLNHVYFSIQT